MKRGVVSERETRSERIFLDDDDRRNKIKHDEEEHSDMKKFHEKL